MSARFRRLDRRRNLPWTGQGRRGKQVDSVISRSLPRCSSARLRFSRSLACRGCGRTFSARTGTARRRPHRDDATWATCHVVERRFSDDLGSGVFGQVSGVVISGDFTGQPRACSGRRRRPNQAEIVTPGFGGRARPLPAQDRPRPTTWPEKAVPARILLPPDPMSPEFRLKRPRNRPTASLRRQDRDSRAFRRSRAFTPRPPSEMSNARSFTSPWRVPSTPNAAHRIRPEFRCERIRRHDSSNKPSEKAACRPGVILRSHDRLLKTPGQARRSFSEQVTAAIPRSVRHLVVGQAAVRALAGTLGRVFRLPGKPLFLPPVIIQEAGPAGLRLAHGRPTACGSARRPISPGLSASASVDTARPALPARRPPPFPA